MSGLGSLVRRHREAARLTQEELADRADLSARTVSDIERGLRSRVYPDTARRLVVALGLSDDETASFLEAARGRRSSIPEAAGYRVPRPLTPLLGRERELRELVDALGGPDGDRLVTVTGLGGIGKSRLALAAAAELEPAYDGRVHLLAIVAGQDPAHVAGAVARSLGVSDRASPEALGAHLGGRPTLLLLDEFEHVIDAAGEIGALLAATPALHVLATSRQRLGVVGEREVALSPLPVPDDTEAGWTESPATRLFVERVRAHSPDLPMEPDVVVDICRRLSGVPLGLELAAARARYLPLRAVRDRLQRGLNDLVEATGGVSGRHRSMEAVLAWSVDGLSADEALVLDVASLFPAGWRLDAAQRLCGDVDVLRATSALVDRNLVLLDRPSDPAGIIPRWRMLDVVRGFVRERTPEVRPGLRERFVGFHLDLVAEAHRSVGREQEWFRVLAAEEPNVRTALAWAAADRDAERLLRLAGGMWQYWQAQGALVEGREWLGAGLSLAPPAQVTTRMTALWGMGWLAYHQGDDPAAQAAADELETLARGEGLAGPLRDALTIHGMLAISRERAGEAVRLLTEALDLAGRAGSGWILATSRLNLGLAHLAAGEVARARDVLAGALAAYEELADERFRARCLGYLGLASLLDDDPVRARALFGQSLAVFHELAEPEGTAEGLAGIAAVDAATGHPVSAALLGGAAERLHESYLGRALPLEQRVTARYLASAEALVGAEAWATQWRRGRELPLAEAVDLAVRGRP